MKNLLILSILLSDFWLNSYIASERSLSPLCSEPSHEIVIDSIVAKDEHLNETLYYFIGDTITVVNYRYKSIEKVEKIQDFFKTNVSNHKIVPPIDIAFTQKSNTDKRILTLINVDNNNHWNISLETNYILGSNDLNNSLIDSKIIDIFNINDTNGYLFSNQTIDLLVKEFEWTQGFKYKNTYRLASKANGTQIALILENNNISGTESMTELNQFLITSGVIFDNKLHLYANRYSCSVSLTINDFTFCDIRNFTDEICNSASAQTESPTSVTSGTGTVSPSNSNLLWTLIISALIVFVLLVTVFLILYFVQKSSKSSQDKSSDPSNGKFLFQRPKEIKSLETIKSIQSIKSEKESEKGSETNVHSKQGSQAFVFSGRDPYKLQTQSHNS